MYSRDLGGQGLVSWVESPHALNPSQRTTTMQNRLVHQTLNPKTRVISRATILINHLSGLVTPLTTTHEPPNSQRPGRLLVITSAYGGAAVEAVFP